jgi:hypothetical protein
MAKNGSCWTRPIRSIMIEGGGERRPTTEEEEELSYYV